MKWCYAASLPALSAVIAAAALDARPALAADRTCAAITVEIDAGVRARWPEAPQQIHEAFDGRDDVDTCAQIELGLAGGSIAVKVVLPDGRAAARVARREDLVPALEALLLVPRRPAPPPAQPVVSRLVMSSAPPPAPTAVLRELRAHASPTVAARHAPVKVQAEAPSRLAIELSIAAGARIGDGQSGGGLGALSFLDISGWLVGLEGRADVYQPMKGGDPAGALGLALLGGRRLRSGTLALDLFAGPAVAREGGSSSVTQPALGGRRIEMTTTEGNSARLRFGARLNFRARSVLRTFVGIDGDFGGRRTDLPFPTDNAPLPLWTLGLALGATVGSL